MFRFSRCLFFSGNSIIIAGATLAITGLTFGGIRFPWDSAQVLVPLILGLVLMVFFLYYERKYATNPCIPWEVVGNRSSLSGYVSRASGVRPVAHRLF